MAVVISDSVDGQEAEFRVQQRQQHTRRGRQEEHGDVVKDLLDSDK